MDQLIILQGVTLDQLLTRIEALIEKQINEKIQKVEPAKPFTYLSSGWVTCSNLIFFDNFPFQIFIFFF